MSDKEFEDIIFGDLGFCGCGDPEAAIKIIYELIKIQHDRRNKSNDYKEYKSKVNKLITGNIESVADILLYIINNAELLEHGTSVGCSWLTDKGKEFIKHYEEIENKEDFLSY